MAKKEMNHGERPGKPRSRDASCPPAPGSKRALQRIAWLIQRGLHGHQFDGELHRLGTTDREFLTRLARTKDKTACYQRYLETLGPEQKDTLAKAVDVASPDGPDPDAVATGADLVRELSQIEWLWRGWIPKAMLTMLVAPPGMGKSAFVLGGIVLPIVQGKPWPDGQPGQRSPDKVLLVDTEGTQGITRDRLIAYRVPPDRILFPTADWKDDVQLDDPDQFDSLRETIRVHRPALVVIDALRSAHSGDENNSRVSRILSGLQVLARDMKVAIVVVHHTRKLADGEPLTQNSARGSNAQTAVPKSVIGIEQPDPDSEWRKVSVIKSNVSVPPNPIGFRIKDSGLEFGPAPGRPQKTTELQSAVDFLRDELGGGERPSKEVQDAASKKGITDKTLRRACKAIGVKVKKKGNQWFWALRVSQHCQKGTARKS